MTYELGFYIYDLKGPKIIKEINHNFPNKMLLKDVDISSGFIAIGARFNDETATKHSDVPKYFYLYTIAGDLLYRKKIVGHGFQFELGSPQVKIIDKGRRVLVTLGNKVQIYKNEFAK